MKSWYQMERPEKVAVEYYRNRILPHPVSPVP